MLNRLLAPALSLALLCPSAHASSWFENWTVKPAAPEKYSLLSGYALTLTALGLRRPLVDDLQAYESRTRPLGHYSKIGDYAGQLIPNALYAGGEYVAARFGHEPGRRRAQVMTVASLESALIATTIKLVIHEERPNHSSRNSFPSGHATTVFAFAAVVGAEHGWAYGIPAYALAAFTGFSRINDNMHYLHDVLAGATIGTSIGLGVALANRAPKVNVVHVTPWLFEEGDGGGLQAHAEW